MSDNNIEKKAENGRKFSSKKIDMTKGPIMRNVLLFAIPIIIGNILQQILLRRHLFIRELFF